MVQQMGRGAARELVDSGRAQVVEVLPPEQYEWAHLPGAVNLPLKRLAAESAAILDRSKPVVVYCNDFL
jgi:rhodanese-related sulfurtransferase